MSQAFFLIPGLLPPADARDAVPPEAFAALRPLFSGLSGEPMRQRLAQGPDQGSCELLWAWAVIARKAPPAPCAAFRWTALGGPELPGCMQQITLLARSADGALVPAGVLPRGAADEAAARLSPVLEDAGLHLQRADSSFFVSGREPSWHACAAQALPLLPESDQVAGDVGSWRSLRAAGESALSCAGIPSGAGPVVSWWMAGEGRFRRLHPPTLLRAVLSDDGAVTGWAQAAGLLEERTGRSSGASAWPADTPRGDCLAVLSDLHDSWRARDWNTWAQRLPAVAEQVRALWEAAREKLGCSQRLVVGCGLRETLSLPAEPPSGRALGLLARLTRAGRSEDPARWIFEE